MAVSMPSEGALVLRLLLAAALAGALGVERELTEQPAGLRTHILVGLGAALFAVISAFGFQAVVAAGPRQPIQADVTRVASQIVVGIGFLGGGAILKYGASIRGLTTAANLWITAAIGTAVGIGDLTLGVATTAIALGALVGLRPLRAVLRRYAVANDEFLIESTTEVDLQRLLRVAREHGASVIDVRITEEGEEQQIHLTLRLPRKGMASEVAVDLAAIGHVRNVDWSG
jgi:putative Mg2+ transporter-C (MgtC) family protein